jgi:hypothetical protein
MQQLLHTMEHNRPLFADEIADPLNPQNVFAVIAEQHRQVVSPEKTTVRSRVSKRYANAGLIV